MRSKVFLVTMLLASLALAQEYQIKYFVGLVEVKKAGNADWAGVTMETKLAAGDSLRTKVESRLELADASGKILSIGELQTLSIDQNLSAQAAANTQEGKKGFMARWRILTGAPSSSRELTSPTAVAAIRGKAADGFAFTDANGDGINDNLLADDNSALMAQPLGVNELLLDNSTFIQNRGRHGVHNDIQPTHSSSGHSH
jgi:hypothetical protein